MEEFRDSAKTPKYKFQLHTTNANFNILFVCPWVASVVVVIICETAAATTTTTTTATTATTEFKKLEKGAQIIC